ncbi:hypothetical protein [Erwinia billingiae]|uniref:hypothetical protein n=1 Tax=Erwinia billingiae TaxID=182337 RepID=UPI000D00726F|nr:hypothetical protein [Erwinia billingiae]PRB60482.1 hypothetical protein CQ001_10055 [Erwinia billingiae]
MYYKSFITVMLFLGVTACTSSPYPLSDQHKFNTVYESMSDAAKKCNNIIDNEFRCDYIAVTNASLNDLSAYYSKEGNNRDRATIISGEGTFYGAIAALAGSLTGATGLLNTGIGVTAFSGAASSHYSTKNQSEVFSKATAISRCYQRNIIELGDLGLTILFINSSDDSPFVARNTIQAIQSRVIKLQDGVNSGLREILMPGVTVDQMITLVKNATPEKKPGENNSKALAESMKDQAGAAPLLKILAQKNSSKTPEQQSESIDLQAKNLVDEMKAIAIALPAKLDLCIVSAAQG